jgi:type VI secretion system protein ImpA
MDLETLLAPVSPEDPCGADLEYDPAFAEIDRLAQGKPEQQIGTTIVPAEEPDWKVVEKKATELLVKSKDLRVGAHLTRALLHTTSWSGFALGLGVLRGMVERYWDGIHPRLDPSDANDPTMRVNVLASFADPAMLSVVRATPLVSSRALGRFSLKDLETAAGEAPPTNGAESPSMASIEGAVMESDLGELQQTVTALHACLEALAGIEAAVGERVDAASAASFGKLPILLRKAESFLGNRLEQRTAAGAQAGDGAAASASTNGAGTARSFAGAVNSREDVIRALDAICSYYAKNEPSSPIPMFMERSKKLVMMSFVDIVKELVPDALSRVDILRGQAQDG